MIIYFSGTGNSEYVANMIKDKLEDDIVNAKQLIKNKSYNEFESNKPWIFIAPTYSWKIPRIFKHFITKSSFKGNKNAYFIITCGGDIGNTQSQVKKLCKKKNLNFKGISEIVMPDNYIALYPVTPQDKSEIIIKKAIPKIEKSIEIIKANDVLHHKKSSIMDLIKSEIVNPLFYKFNAKSQKFYVTQNKCISCGKCAKNCPLNNIELINGFPCWKNTCTHCMTCISYCPTESIDYGKKTIGRLRYTCKKYNNTDNS